MSPVVTAPVVTLSEVGKRYGPHWAAREVSLTLAAGERLALLGHNGAGKTTLMKLILGLIRPDAGHLSVFGGPPGEAASPVRRAMGFLPENVAFHDAMTGRETLNFYARLKGCPPQEGLHLLDRVGLVQAAERRVGTYSKGMRQRLGLAQALLGGPRLLLLDEPTTGLDPALRHSFYDIIRALSAQGTAVLLSSHLLTELEERTDRIAIMDRGRVAALGTLDELRRQAGLPVQIRLAIPDSRQAEMAQALSTLADLSPVPQAGFGLVVFCSPAHKMMVLRRALSQGSAIMDSAIVDVEVIQPGLDAIYAAFTNGHAEEPA